MAPSIAELLAALPDELHDESPAHPDAQAPEQFSELFAKLSRRPVPTGACRRLWHLGGLPARIAAGSLIYWVRGAFQDAAARERSLLESRLRSAVRVLATMSYLRGAATKIGQLLADFPQVVPKEFAETLATLHFEAPPMHYSLLREHVRNELGGDPEDLFDRFETIAFAAASLGQVHRAQLKTGQDVAVKIQYPGIARSIRADFRTLSALLAPMRLSKDWDNLKQQFDGLRRNLELETDYEREADSLRTGRSLFGEDDGILVPRVYPEFSTRRVLTMEYINGKTIDGFLASDPPQQLRDHFGEQIYRATTRLFCMRRMFYCDPHPGNFLFLDDGRLGFLDFGAIREFNDEEWEYTAKAPSAMYGTQEDVLAHVQRGLEFTDEEMVAKADYVNLIVEGCHYFWRPLVHEGPFDFSDPEYLREGFDFLARGLRAHEPRQKPVNWFFHRGNLETAGLFYRLGARVDCKRIAEQEGVATGW